MRFLFATAAAQGRLGEESGRKQGDDGSDHRAKLCCVYLYSKKVAAQVLGDIVSWDIR